MLEVDESDEGRLIQSIKQQLRRIPNRGVGYGVLRYLDDPAGLIPTTPLDVTFNYLGQLDSGLSTQAGSFLFGFAQEPSGQFQSPAGLRSHALDINAIVVQGQLQIVWSYSRNIHHQGTIEQVADDYLHTLQRLIAHCTSATAGGFTPGDFTATDLTQMSWIGWFAGNRPKCRRHLRTLTLAAGHAP